MKSFVKRRYLCSVVDQIQICLFMFLDRFYCP